MTLTTSSWELAFFLRSLHIQTDGLARSQLVVSFLITRTVHTPNTINIHLSSSEQIVYLFIYHPTFSYPKTNQDLTTHQKSL